MARSEGERRVVSSGGVEGFAVGMGGIEGRRRSDSRDCRSFFSLSQIPVSHQAAPVSAPFVPFDLLFQLLYLRCILDILRIRLCDKRFCGLRRIFAAEPV